MRIEVPGEGDFDRVAAFPVELRKVGLIDDLDLDFSGVRFTPPSWLVVVGGALRQLKLDHPHTKKRAVHFKHLTYAAHMGFFEYFGLRFGHEPGAAAGSDTYVPLSVRRTEDVRHQAALLAVPVGEAVHAEAERLASVLTRQTKDDLHETLAYSIREIIRNVVEHSEADDYTIAAQFWPARNLVEIVVADQGIGIAQSLRENPQLTIGDDGDALKQAVLPGVSSKAWRRSQHYDEWANSGYGLFMTERLCRLGGSFELMSGNRLLRVTPNRSALFDADWPGTVVVLRLDTRDLGKLGAHLTQFRDEGCELEYKSPGEAVGPSIASQSTRPHHRNNENE